MSEELDVLLRLLAFEKGRAISATSHLQVSIKPDAWVICPLAMAGEDASVHIIAFGALGRDPEILCVPDPLVRDDQYELFRRLGARVEQYFLQCRASATYPQIWVSGGAAACLLDAVAERLCTARGTPDLKRAGELLSYCTERYPVAGQQTLHAATDVLRLHFATGQQEGEDEHLGALLTWIRPPARVNILKAVAAAEKQPMGCKTDPEFDRSVLERRVDAYSAARRAGASAASLRLRAQGIVQKLDEVVRPIYKATQRAVRILQSSRLPLLPDLTEMDDRERREFEAFMQSRDAGYPVLIRDTPKAAAFKFSAREDAVQNVAAAVGSADRIARARAKLSGDILTGIVENPQTRRLGPRRFEYSFVVVSDQRILRVRRRDKLQMMADPRLEVVVTEVRRRGRITRVSATITKGSQAVGLPRDRQGVEFGTGRANWAGLILQRKQLSERLKVTPWTHSRDPMPPASPKKRRLPADLVAAVEALR